MPTSILVPLLSLFVLNSPDLEPPPGMVLLESRTITVGLDEAAAKELVLKAENVNIWGETPEHEVTVDDFFLMLTEVTNEQYAEFVAATRAKPPASWGKATIDAAQASFLDEHGRLRSEAKQRGELVPETQIFDRLAWWDLHWHESDSELPAGFEAHPVTHVDNAQAKAYARWAGLRLMTEQEFQRAVRGTSKFQHPWGEAFEPGRAVTLEGKFRMAQPVGSMPTGASAEGIHDLLGNVWEWTDSRYEPYPKHRYDAIEIVEGERTRYVELQCDFDSDLRVAVGGSYANEALAARATTRRSVLRNWATDVLGFRCAKSSRAGFDVASETLRTGLDRSVAREVDFDLARTLALDRWESRTGSAAQRHSSLTGNDPLGGYAVITDYDYFVFAPVAELDVSGPRELASESLAAGPQILGFFSTSLSLREPGLAPGDYVLAWRGAGKGRPRADEDEDGDPRMRPAPLWEELGFDPNAEHFVILDRRGEPLVALPARGVVEENEPRDGSIERAQGTPDERAKAHDEIRVTAAVPAAGQWLVFDVTFALAPGALSGDWRPR